MHHSEKNLADNALIAYSNKKSILTHYAETLTIKEAMYQPSIRKLVNTSGEAPMLIFVTDLLHEFLSFVPNGLNSDEIVLYAEKILAHCPTWSTADLVLCLKNGMDGKYGEVKYHWKWTVFIEWTKRYDQQKSDYFFNNHVEKTNNGKLADQDLIKLLPKELIEKFAKEKFVNQEKRKRLDVKIPKEIIDKGLKAVDEWIEENIKK